MKMVTNFKVFTRQNKITDSTKNIDQAIQGNFFEIFEFIIGKI